MKRIACLFIVSVILISCKKDVSKFETPIVKNTILEGSVFGTYYRVTYDSEENYQNQLDSLFYTINKSLSTYQVNSDISKLNRNETVEIDTHFLHVFRASKEIYQETKGAFDPTIGIMVNAWDFGPEGKVVDLDSLRVKSLMISVGFDKVTRSGSNILKPEETFLDFNAIAKGYAVDVISTFLSRRGADNHLVDIGGELKAKGINAQKGKAWKVGVENPNFDGTQSINRAISLKDEAMATSGTYRKFKVDEDGNRYAHIIDTKSGYPSKTNLLSISVITKSCMLADAYATAFKAMGIEGIKAFVKEHAELKVFLIYENDNQELKTLALNGFPES